MGGRGSLWNALSQHASHPHSHRISLQEQRPLSPDAGILATHACAQPMLNSSCRIRVAKVQASQKPNLVPKCPSVMHMS